MSYRTILAAVDGTELATRALQRAASIAEALGASLSIVTVSSPPPSFASSEIGWSVPASVYEQIRAASAAAAQKLFADARANSTVPLKETIHVESSGAAEGILDAAGKLGADLIVMGSHGHRGINRLILGSQAAKVLSQSEISVLIVK
jgi:nucleotide-binding universal stress UspA family protein